MTTALWIWRDLESPEDFDLTADHIASIRSLAAGWNTLEAGAAGLVFPGEAEAGEVDQGSDLARACEIFLNCADPGDWRGTICNPYRHPAYNEALSEGDLALAPDQSAIAPLASGEDFEFAASPEEITAWGEADLRCHGIDPKRPFGMGNVERDLAPIVDPEGALSEKDLTQRVDYVQTRMVLALQYFVQHARIEPGLYGAGDHSQWERRGSEGAAKGELLDHEEWCARIHASFAYQTQDYITCCEHLSYLVWENRASGDYASLVRQFRLDSFYEDETRRRYDGATTEQLSAAVQAFPQDFHQGSNVFLASAAVRMHNSRAEFTDALDLLASSGWEAITLDDEARGSPARSAFLVLEALVASYGSKAISDTQYQAIIANENAEWNTRFGGDPWELIWKLVHQPDVFGEPVSPVAFQLCRAAALQLMLMRGGFVPDDND